MSDAVFRDTITGELRDFRSRDVSLAITSPTTSSLTGGVITIDLSGDFDSSSEALRLNIEGIDFGPTFDNIVGNDRFDRNFDRGLQFVPMQITAELTQAELNSILADGVVDLDFSMTGNVDFFSVPFFDVSIAFNEVSTIVDLNGADEGRDLTVFLDTAALGAGIQIADSGLIVSNTLGNEIDSIVVSLTNSQNDAGEALSFDGIPSGVTVTGSGTDQITLTRSGGTTADMTDALLAITYRNADGMPDLSDRIIEVVATDSVGDVSAVATTTLTTDVGVAAQNDAFAVDDDAVLNGDLFADNGNGADNSIAPLAITAINGDAALVGGSVTLGSGVVLTVQSDGTFEVDASALERLIPGRTVTETFSYTVTAGTSTDDGQVSITVNGIDNDDLFIGTNANDTIDAGFGDDEVRGKDGDDLLSGQDGDDLLIGAGGADTLNGGDGNDSAAGGDGDDLLLGLADDDTLSGGNDNDELRGGFGNDLLLGGRGRDLLLGQADDDSLSGGIGDDSLDGGAGNDILAGGRDFDRLHGQDGDDTILGGSGDDSMDGGFGDDRLLGGRDNDRLFGGNEGNDLLAGGTGDDRLFGENGNDRLNGGRDFDRLDGGVGDDLLNGGLGNDTMTGGAGLDRFIFTSGTGRDVVTDFASGDRLVIRGFGPALDEFAEVIAASYQSGADVVINLDNGDMVTVQNTLLGDLGASDFIIA